MSKTNGRAEVSLDDQKVEQAKAEQVNKRIRARDCRE